MLQAIIRSTSLYHVISHGNGLAYEMQDRESGDSLFVQGDDAEGFRQEWASLEQAYPEAGDNMILADLWAQYAVD